MQVEEMPMPADAIMAAGWRLSHYSVMMRVEI